MESCDLRNFCDSLAPFNPLTSTFPGAPGRIRTSDARFRKPTLYPLSYGGWSGDHDQRTALGRESSRP